MASTWHKLKKTLSLPLSSQSSDSSSISLEVAPSSDISLKDLRTSKTMPTSASSSRVRISRTSGHSGSRSSSKRICAICLGNMKTGQGKAIFTAECSHAFHFNCIVSSVKHGNQLCPICRSKWHDIPFQAPTGVIDSQLNGNGQANVASSDSPLDEFHASLHRQLPQQLSPQAEPHHFSDDEPLHGTTFGPSTSPSFSSHPVATIRAFPEFPAVPAAENRPEFAVLFGVKAPVLPVNTHHCHAPIDLVTVLDVSGSMAGTKLTLLKRAVHFVIRNLGPADRLAIIAFSSTARRIFPLCRMSDAGRDHAIMAINSLRSTGGTNIVEGLKKGVRILEERREQNPVASIVLLSDGKDTYNVDSHNHRRSSHNQASSHSRRVSDYLSLLPSSICPNNSASRSREGGSVAPFQVHTFGFGSDHDATAMHAISDASGGMFSFIQTASMIQDAFARCIGGLLSVVAQELRLTVRSISPGVCIGSIPAGKYSSEILNRGQLGVVEVGDLYADEEKDFLVYVSVPVFSDEECGEATSLLCVECSYKVPQSQEVVQAESKIVVIRRPGVLSSEDNRMSLEVDRQRNRLWVAEGIAQAQSMAEKGNLEGAQIVLASRRSALLDSTSAQAGDALCNWLEAELKEIRDRMVSQELYEQTGRAYVLSGLSSHSWQRATTRGDSTTHSMAFNRGSDNQSMNGAMGYETPSMVSMVTRSQTINIRTGGSSEQAHHHLLNRACGLVPH